MNFLKTLSVFVFLLIEKVKTCDFYQALKPDVIYTIVSPNYARNYFRGTDCRWAAEAPPGFKVLLNCNEVRLPLVFLCGDRIDRILVSNSGRVNLADARRHCGGVAFTETSTSTKMVIALKTTPTSRGGRFKCSLKAVPNSCRCGQLNRGRIGAFCPFKQFIKVFDKLFSMF